MHRFALVSPIVAIGAIACSTDAAVTAYASQASWASAPGNAAGTVFASGTTASFGAEDFDGTVGTGMTSISGGSGWSAWTATSATAGGTLGHTGSAIYSAPAGSTLLITFTGASNGSQGLYGVGGEFRFFDSSGTAVDGRIWVRLSNGSSVMRTFTAAAPFVGFWSNDLGAPIQSLRIQPLGTGLTTFVGIDTLFMATVPAPGSVALLAAVGLIGSRRRR